LTSICDTQEFQIKKKKRKVDQGTHTVVNHQKGKGVLKRDRAAGEKGGGWGARRVAEQTR